MIITLDPQFIRAMLIALLGAASDMKIKDMSSWIEKEKTEAGKGVMKKLVDKAEIGSDFGGAKIAFIINSMLQDLFQGVMELDRGHSKILIEMIAGMIVNGSYHHPVDLKEGPKRG